MKNLDKIVLTTTLALLMGCFPNTKHGPPTRQDFARTKEKVVLFDELKPKNLPQIFYLYDDERDGKVDVIADISEDALYITPNHKVPKKASYEVRLNPSWMERVRGTDIMPHKLGEAASSLYYDLEDFYFHYRTAFAGVYSHSPELIPYNDERRYPIPLKKSTPGVSYPLNIAIYAKIKNIAQVVAMLYDDDGDGVVDVISPGVSAYPANKKKLLALFVKDGYKIPNEAAYAIVKDSTKVMPPELQRAASKLLKTYPPFKDLLETKNKTHSRPSILSIDI